MTPSWALAATGGTRGSRLSVPCHIMVLRFVREVTDPEGRL
jgi:hypothetical protein